MNLKFTKYHGSGNDFIMVDARDCDQNSLNNEKIALLCDRHFGIGADGLIILEESETYDFKMLYYNADGFLGSMCGNGGRCIVEFARKQGWIYDRCIFEAADGPHQASVLGNGNIRLGMRDVKGIAKVPEGFYLNTGSPHLVIFTEALDQVDVVVAGRKLRYSPAFPDGTNVNFVELHNGGIKVRTYERGVENETLSCGTGVTASAIVSSLANNSISVPVSVTTPGGSLLVEFSTDASANIFSDIHLTGSANEVFQGRISV